MIGALQKTLGSIFYWDRKMVWLWVVLRVDLCREETTRVGRQLSNEPILDQSLGFLTRRSTRALRASLKALVDTELVGALLDGEDRRAGGDALRQGGGAGGGHRGVVGIVDVLGLHMPGVLVLMRVVHIVVVLHLLVLVLVHRDLLYCNPSREFLRNWWPCCCCCCC